MLYPEDLWFLEKIIDKKEINLVSIICAKMVIARVHSKKFIPYGCLITAFIRTKFSHIKSLSIRFKNHIRIFNHASLHKMGCIYDETHCKYIKVVHCHQKYNYEMESKHEEEDKDEDALAQDTPTSHHEAGLSSQVTPDMLASLQSTIIEGFATMTQKFEDTLKILNEKVDKNHRCTKEHMDSLSDQKGNLEELVVSHHRPSSPNSLGT